MVRSGKVRRGMARGRLAVVAANFALVLSGCGSEAIDLAGAPDFCQGISPQQGFASADSGGVQVITNLRAFRDVNEPVRVSDDPVLTIGLVAGDAEYEFGQVNGAARLADGRIVVADGRNFELRVFDSTGTYIGAHGGQGAGPGEYRFLTALFKTEGDVLWIEDTGNQRVTMLDAELAVVASRSLPTVPWTMGMPDGSERSGASFVRMKGVFGDGSMLGTHSLRRIRTGEVTNVSRDSLILRLLPADAQQSDSLGMILGIQLYEYYPGDGSVWFGESPFGFVESLAVASDRFYYGDANEFEIQERRPGGEVARLIRICESNPDITAERINALIQARLDGLSDEDRVREEATLRAILQPREAPAYLRLIVDELDRLWARDFTFPGEPQRWKIIDVDGRWLTDVEMPADIEVMEVGADYVLTRHTTDFGVHTVRLYDVIQ